VHGTEQGEAVRRPGNDAYKGDRVLPPCVRAFSDGAGLACAETLRLFFEGGLFFFFEGGLFLGGDLPTCSGLWSTMVLRESLECVLVVPGSKCAIVEILFLADVVDLPGQTLAPPHLALVDLADLVDPPCQTLTPPRPALVGNGTIWAL